MVNLEDIMASSANQGALSRWVSSSTAATEFEQIWDNDPSLSTFYPTEDTLDSLDFNADDAFLGSLPFPDLACPGSAVNMDLPSKDALSSNPSPLSATGIKQSPPQTSMTLTGQAGGHEDSLAPTAQYVQTLQDQIKEALCRGDGGRQFLPVDDLRRILSDKALEKELARYDPTVRLNVQTIIERYPRVFATLAMMSQDDKIINFLAEGVNDADLALVKVARVENGQTVYDLRRKNALDVPLKSFEGWTSSQMEQFEKLQWLFLSPVFSSASEKKVALSLEDKVVLPFTESTEHAKKDHYRGGNSEVFRVKVHPAHHDFGRWDITATSDEPSFAVKRLLSTDEESFRREVEVLQRLTDAEHPHVVSLLATYRYKGYYHLVFPWAEGDLRRLWNTHPEPNPGKNEAQWLASQCSGIASALNHVHNGAYGSNGQLLDQDQLNGRHGDIKPENILVYNRPEHLTEQGQMKLSDFGGGLFFDAHKGPDPLHQVTKTYRPPEYDTKNRPVSRSWDVWGLGCTYVEFLTWFLEGAAGLNEFAKRRTTYNKPGVHSDEYFELFDPGEIGTVTAFLKGSVIEWITALYCHKNSSQFVRDFLDFITNRMFVVENGLLSRASSSEVSMYLDELTRKCFEDESYCSPSPGGRPPWELSGMDELLFSSPASDPTSEPLSVNHHQSPDRFYTSPILDEQNSLFSEFLAGMANHTAPAQMSFDGLSTEKKRKRSVEDDPPLHRTSPPVLAQTAATEQVISLENSPHKEGEMRFACPFYKNNPCKFRKWRTCGGPGWPTVHRVKEHLYRRHTIGKHTCSRCMLRCKNAKELLDHQRATVPCEMRTDAFPEGTMLPCQEETLRLKKRVAPNTTEEQKWIEVYKVLFPGEKLEAMPTPYYEDEVRPEPLAKAGKDSPASVLSEYERYLSEELPSKVQKDLETEIRSEFGMVGDAAQMGKMVDIARKLQLRLFRHYELSQQANG